MPDLLDSIFKASISTNLVRVSRAARNRLLRYDAEAPEPSNSQTEATSADTAISYKAEAKLKLAVFLCELIASAQSGSTILTPAKVGLGVLLLIGGLHRRTHHLLSAQQLVCGPTSAKLIVDGYLRQLQQKLQKRVDELRGVKTWIKLVMIDNYCTQQFQKNKHSDQAFTHLCATVAVLMTFFEKSAPTGVEPACFTFDFDRIGHVTCGSGVINVYLVSPIFHIRMHVLANLTNDPVNLVLIWCPFLFAIGLQRDKMKAKRQQQLMRQQEG
ncbi:hypothetical protein B484DRAFT_411297 [Ochromonadaceae sp. CCMP2298]|nr:hypothetical protein B484DRAFT_411297 [Ochromonadaceae sp. CCMP2298]